MTTEAPEPVLTAGNAPIGVAIEFGGSTYVLRHREPAADGYVRLRFDQLKPGLITRDAWRPEMRADQILRRARS